MLLVFISHLPGADDRQGLECAGEPRVRKGLYLGP